MANLGGDMMMNDWLSASNLWTGRDAQDNAGGLNEDKQRD